MSLMGPSCPRILSWFLVSFATIKLSDCDDHMEKPDRSDCSTIVAAKFASNP